MLIILQPEVGKIFVSQQVLVKPALAESVHPQAEDDEDDGGRAAPLGRQAAAEGLLSL